MPRRRATRLLAAAAVGLSLLRCGTGATRRATNVLLIGIDTLRADHLSCYGYGAIRTPRIDGLARGGVRFERETAHVPITLPSFSTILTSTLPPANGVHSNEGFRLDGSAVTLAEILRGKGYRTGAVIAAVVLDSANGLAQGFERYDDDIDVTYTGYQLYARRVQAQLSHTQRRAGEVTDRALAMVDSLAGEAPFFLFVHYFDPHAPYDPPPPYNLVDPLVTLGSTEHSTLLYDGEIAYTDEQVGRLLDGLAGRGLLENTLVVLTADHGDALDEHGERTHAFFTYESTLHVPLIYSLPGRLPAGMSVSGLSRHIDIAPTILDIVGIAPAGCPTLQGVSRFPFDRAAGGEPAYIECAVPNLLFGWCGLRGVRDGEWKYIEAPREELYDLATDPGERDNRAAAEPEIVDSLRAKMQRLVSEAGLFRGGEPGQEMSARSAGEVDAAMREKLRALGYVGANEEVRSTYEAMFDRSRPDPKEKIGRFSDDLAARLELNMGVGLLREDSLAAAIEHLETAVGKAPAMFDAHHALGRALARAGRSRRAAGEFERALAIEPGRVDARLDLARMRGRLGDVDAALRETDAALSGADGARDLYRGARLLARLGRADAATAALERAVAIDSTFVPARLALAEHALGGGDPGRALALLTPVEGRAMDDSLAVRVFSAAGRCYYRQGAMDRAAERFRRVIAIDSTRASACNSLGLIEDARGEYDRAIGWYDRARALDPGMHEVSVNRGVALFKAGRYAEARADLERYLPHTPGEEEAGRVRALLARIEELETAGEEP